MQIAPLYFTMALGVMSCEKATPTQEPHQAMMPVGAPPMPHADNPMAMNDAGTSARDAAIGSATGGH